MPNLTIEEIAQKTLPILTEDLSKNEDFLKKLEKMPINEETKKELEVVKATGVKMEESLKSIELALAERKKFEQEHQDEDGKFGFKSLSEFMTYQFQADSLKKDARDEDVDPRIKKLDVYKSKIRAEHVKAGTGPLAGDSTYGGILIPPGLGAPLIDQALKDTGLWEQMVNIPMSVPSIEFPTPENWDHSSGYYYGGIYASFQGEIETINERRPQFGSIKLSLEAAKLASAPSNKMIMFSPTSIEAMLRQMMSEALVGLLADKAINGTGSGEPMGYIVATPSSGGPGVQVTRDTASHIYANDILAMDMAFRDRGNGVWLANHNCKTELRNLSIAAGTGAIPMYQYANGNMPMDTLLGRRIIFTEFCQSLGTKGDIILVDPSQYLRGSFSTNPMFDTSAHVYFLNSQTVIKLEYYCDARPMWKTYLTPRYATTSYLSPYVMLS